MADNLVTLATFRVIQGSKEIPEATFPEPGEPTADAAEVLTNAVAAAAEYRRAFVIFEDHEGGFDFMYSTTTNAEKLLMLEVAKQWVMSP